MKQERTVYTRQAITAAIAYTNLLHIQHVEPALVRRDDPELWNQQMIYADQLLDWMLKEGFLG